MTIPSSSLATPDDRGQRGSNVRRSARNPGPAGPSDREASSHSARLPPDRRQRSATGHAAWTSTWHSDSTSLLATALPTMFSTRRIAWSANPCSHRMRARKHSGRRALVENVANDLRADHRRLILVQHALDIAPGLRLVAHEMEQIADHTIADETILRVGVALRRDRRIFSAMVRAERNSHRLRSTAQSPQSARS